MTALAKIAKRHGLALVEDCAQAHGAEIEGRRAGSVGDAAAFSFYPTKNLGALGDGGAVVTREPGVAERARLLRNYGERERFEHVLHGRNSRLDALQAAFLSAKLPHLDEWTDRRRRIAARYGQVLEQVEGVGTPIEAKGRRHVYHLYVVESAERDQFRERLAVSGVETGIHYPRPIHAQPAYRSRGGKGLACQRAAVVAGRESPLYPELTDAEVELVCAALDALP